MVDVFAIVVMYLVILPLILALPLQAEVKIVESSKSKTSTCDAEKVSKNKMSRNDAEQVLLEHGFLPQLPSQKLPEIALLVQTAKNTNYERKNILAAKKPIIIHFWATWCGPCKHEMPHFASFVNGQDAFSVFTVTSELNDGRNQDALKIWEFYESKTLTGINVCSDLNGNLASSLDVAGIPATFVVSANGTLLGRFLGATDWKSPALTEALISFAS